jgi:hypothetical protein
VILGRPADEYRRVLVLASSLQYSQLRCLCLAVRCHLPSRAAMAPSFSSASFGMVRWSLASVPGWFTGTSRHRILDCLLDNTASRPSGKRLVFVVGTRKGHV